MSAETFLAGRGCVYVVGEKKAGIYRVEGLSDIQGESGGGHVLIMSVHPIEQDLVLQHISINGKKILYTTGKDFGGLRITGEVLLGREAGDIVSRVQQWFDEVRIGVSDEPVNVSAGGQAKKAYLVSFGLAEANAEYNTVGFTIDGLTATPENRS